MLKFNLSNFFKTTDERLDKMESSLKLQEETINQLQEENQKLKESLKLAETEVVEKSSELATKEEQLEDAKKELEEAVESLEEAVTSVVDANEKASEIAVEKLSSLGVEAVNVEEVTTSESVPSINDILGKMSQTEAVKFWNKNKEALKAGTFDFSSYKINQK